MVKSNVTNGKPYTWRHVRYGLGASTRKPPTARWVWRWVLSPHNEEQDVKKKIMMVVGACIFLIAAAQALPMFFGIGA